ncbi:antibiotic biosynthesis monooxygenase [Ensifer sp. ENS04]|uniref:antibiotic biosynthesis monooxygenase family protein n=1 Tax=Ensifer sp. ENS04 TaxID=2769281 RepID=UPI0017864450|nr:antibiotic biosynthesis monooxygenase [Ensifer sp. ENS04]MBD9541439.1 antibiotic biosynthesis monooxygenase [Ensifer sp. ENS04]
MIVTVFRSRLNPEAQDEYGVMAKRMSELACKVPGYVSHKVFVAEDGERVTIVEFETEDALREWKDNPEHIEAKRLGYKKFFSAFRYQICSVLRARKWEAWPSES